MLIVSVGVASVLGGGAAVVSGARQALEPCGGTPTLRLVDSEPVKLKGAGFCAGERVRVRARAGDSSRSRRLRAGDGGGFRVRFGALDHDPCAGSLTASAWSGGDLRASLKHAQKLCPVPMQPPADPSGPSGSGQDKCGGAGAAPIEEAAGKPRAQPYCPPS
jgi:hypothetical protein